MQTFLKKQSIIIFISILLSTGMLVVASPPLQSENDNPTPAVIPMIPQTLPPEAVMTDFRLNPPERIRDPEMSGLAWYGDRLIILLQYPKDALYVVEREAIQKWIQREAPEVDTEKFPFAVDGRLIIEGFQGYEAIAIEGDTVYLTLESSYDGAMHSHLMRGTISDDGIMMHVDTLVEIPQPINIGNRADESIVIADGQPFTLYEWNSEPNPGARANLYNEEDGSFTPIPFPPFPYRVTDATAMDENGRFWIINYKSEVDGERQPEPDTLLDQLNYRGTHGKFLHNVERLIELELRDGEIVQTDTPPIYLELQQEGRNWEGIVRWGPDSFIMVTDTYPTDIIALIRAPAWRNP